MTIKATRQYKKDFKKYRNIPSKVEKVFSILNMLAKGEKIPKEYLPHKLEGAYKGCMECHIENDLLLIWFDKKNNVIKLIRLGSHAELF
jgi:mRNA interferase YafQ